MSLDLEKDGRAGVGDAPVSSLREKADEEFNHADSAKNAAPSTTTAPLLLDLIPLHGPKDVDAKGRPVGKAPLHSGWRRSAPMTDDEAAAHFARGKNVGARLRDDQLVVDADPRNYAGDDDALARLRRDVPLPYGPTVATGGGGFHLYLRKPTGLKLRDTLEKYPGVEFKTLGRQVVVPPSIHPNGKPYNWDPLLDRDMAVPDAPDALLDLLRRPPVVSAAADGDMTSEQLSMLLEGLDARNFSTNDLWLPIAMASHYETGGHGLDVFLDWCETDPDYADKLDTARRRWESFSAHPKSGAYTKLTLYKALHSAGRSDLVEAVERSDPLDDFPDDLPDDPAVKVARPRFLENRGRVEANYRNTLIAIERAQLGVANDELAQRAVLRAERLPWTMNIGRELNDDLIRIVREWVMHQFGFEPARADVSDVLLALATKNPFNPVVEYLEGLVWDGVRRIDGLFPSYFGAADGAYERAVGRKLMLAAARRARRPGAKFDAVPIIEGKQGTGKTSALRILGGEWHSDAELGRIDGKDAAAILQGVWIMELGELTAMNKAEVEHLKAFVSRCEDRYRPPYAQTVKTFQRRCVFVGTTNSASYLRDQTGNRRYLPVATATIDLERLRLDKDQLWAEAAAAEATGEDLALPQALWAVAAERQGDRLVEDPWLDLLRGYVVDKTRVASKELFESVLELACGRQSQTEAKRLSALMAQLGFRHKRSLRCGDKVTTGYVNEADPAYGM
jgi:predicted P-loop ATPase